MSVNAVHVNLMTIGTSVTKRNPFESKVTILEQKTIVAMQG